MKIDEKQIHNEHRITFFIIKGCLILSSLIFFIAFITFLLPFEKAVLIANKLASDGYFESFTPLLYKQIQVPGLVLEGLIIIFFLTALFRFSQTRRIILNWQKWVPIFWGEFVHDWKKLFLNLKKYLNKNIVVSLVLLALLAFIIRLFLLWQPMDHDESYTSVIFAFEPLYRGLADYHFPNNHVFHTLLVHISYLIFGPQEWAVRLPAFSAGVLLAPLGFILAERWYGKQTAIFAGILIAMTPELIRYSDNARGYSLMAMFTILLFIAAHYVKRTKNYAAWSLMIIFGVLGFYTLPIMVYPLVILYSWLGLSWVIGDYSNNYIKVGFLWNHHNFGFFHPDNRVIVIYSHISQLGFWKPFCKPIRKSHATGLIRSNRSITAD